MPDKNIEDDITALTSYTKPNPDQTETSLDIVKKVSCEQDIDRIEAGTSLVNTFNFAIQVQANRVQWQASDYRAFLIALCALDSIGKTATVQQGPDKREG